MSPDWLPVVIAGGLWLKVAPHQLTLPYDVLPAHGSGAMGSVMEKRSPDSLPLPESCRVDKNGVVSFSLRCAHEVKS